MTPDCIFCKIVAEEMPAHRVAETPAAIAFLDTRPLFEGHVLVIPRAHVPDFAALPPDSMAPLFGLTQRLALAFERGLGAQGAFVALNHRVSQSVAHLHVHVVPRTKGDGLKGFFWPRRKYANDAAAGAIAARIREALATLPDSVAAGLG